MMATILLTLLVALLLLGVIVAVAWPLLKRRQLAATAMLSLFLAGGSAGLYLIIGSPDLIQPQQASADAGGNADGQQATAGDIEQMVQNLADRLERQPDDQEGWTMLGRSYVLMGRYGDAADAFQKAISLSGNDSGFGAVNLRAAYAEARALQDPASLGGETGQLFETVLEADPSNPRGLWYGGLAAAQRGDSALAIERWQSLLKQQDLPPQFRQVVQGRLAELDPNLVDSLVRVEVGVAADASAPPAATLFVFIRDPAKPGPPLAARRVSYNRLPVSVNITSADLISGDSLPQGPVEVGAVLTESGNASDASWRGAREWQPSAGDPVQITLQPVAEEMDKDKQ